MCSTPKGSGLTTRVNRIEEKPRDARAYVEMLKRASRRYEERQRKHHETETDAEEGPR